MSVYSNRIQRVQESLRRDGFDFAVFAPSAQMRYLTGWGEDGHERLLALIVPASGEPILLVPEINAAQARSNPAGIHDVRGWADETGWHAAAQAILGGARRIGIDDELLSGHLIGIQETLPSVACRSAGDMMARLREIKTADEIACLERSAVITDAVYEECKSEIRVGMTEMDLRDIVSAAYKRRGTHPEFAIICFGANSALPHHSSGDTRLKSGDVIIMDIGCRVDDYFSDITRTLAYGRSDSEACTVYDIVYRAHKTAFEAIRPGVACGDVDKAARDVIAETGYGPQFFHRTGHGIGLSGHEAPYIVGGSKQLLKSGMCFSDEPGIYLEGRFGVRIENIVTVTDGGARSLNAPPSSGLLCIEEKGTRA